MRELIHWEVDAPKTSIVLNESSRFLKKYTVLNSSIGLKNSHLMRLSSIAYFEMYPRTQVGTQSINEGFYIIQFGNEHISNYYFLIQKPF